MIVIIVMVPAKPDITGLFVEGDRPLVRLSHLQAQGAATAIASRGFCCIEKAAAGAGSARCGADRD